MPRKVTVPLGITAVVLCAALAPIQWAQGNTAGAAILGVLALVSSVGLASALRRPAPQPLTSPAGPATPTTPRPPASSAPAPGQDPRWHVETLADHLPDPADRRKVVRWFLAIAVVCLAGFIACCIATAINGDLSIMALAVLLAVIALVLFYGVARNRADL